MKRPVWLPGRLGDPDATHSLRAPSPPRTRFLPWALGAALLVAVSGVLLATRHAPPAAVEVLPLADEAALLAAPTDALSLWRFASAPRIVVAIFPTLHAQAMALNRVAAFIERPGVPHDHLLEDASLFAVLGGTPEAFDSYYYGHDYREADLARFYATADRDHIALNDPERSLRTRLLAAGFFTTDAPTALITLPPQGPGLLDASARATILHHELAHGAYFTDPAYTSYVTHFWTSLTDKQRAGFRSFLATEAYDTANDDLMRNETQAYLVFTADPRMFDPARIGIPEAPELRTSFIAALPRDWLRREAVGK